MSRATKSHSQYRPDIDGLRAVAILPVVLFHAGLTAFSGGYIGVDVFFVISGYLITSLILNELNVGKFSFINFWMRRARRILPALFVVVVFTLFAGWFILFPTDYKDLGRAALTQAVFSSNIYFWLKSGYFAAPSETKPLLHTWSLSVEEQYYLFIPLTLFLLTKYLNRFSERIIFLLLVVSFLVSAWSSFAYPDAAFYLPHSRAWELLMGSLLAMVIVRRKAVVQPAAWVGELLSVAGLAAIIGAAMFYGKSTPFPGVAALAPCVGTAAIIWSNHDRLTYAGRVLAHPWLVGVGLISYSLYLWHWPLLAFARYSSSKELSNISAIGIALGSVLVAWLSYRYVETPFRRGPTFRRRVVTIPAAAAALILMFWSGAYVNATKGASGREAFQVATFDNDVRPSGQRDDLCNEVTSVRMQYDFICRLGSVSNSKSKVLLVGDSFAAMYLKPLEILSRAYGREVWYVKEKDMAVHPGVMKVIRKYDISRVVLSYSWNRANKNGIPELYPQRGNAAGWLRNIAGENVYERFLGFGDTKADFRTNLKLLIGELMARNIGVSIIDSPPYYPVSIPLKLGILVKNGGDPRGYGSPLSKHLAEQAYIYDVFNEVRSAKVRIITVTDALCDQTGFCRTYLDGHSLYSDEAHLSDFGAEQTIPVLRSIFAPEVPVDVSRK